MSGTYGVSFTPCTACDAPMACRDSGMCRRSIPESTSSVPANDTNGTLPVMRRTIRLRLRDRLREAYRQAQASGKRQVRVEFEMDSMRLIIEALGDQ